MDRLRLWSGRTLSRMKLCRVERICDRLNGEAISKRRYRYSTPLLRASAFIPGFCPHVRGLEFSEWKAWETEVWKNLYARELTTIKRGLLFPILPGEPLSKRLSSELLDLNRKLSLIAAAAQSLRQAHQMSMAWPDGSTRNFSHSDAHVGNVLCAQNGNHAHWFDFETIHHPDLPCAWRHADDLRALAYSAAALLDEQVWRGLGRCLVHNYPDPAVLEQLARLAGDIANASPDLLHYSQAPMNAGKQRRFSTILLGEIAKIHVRAFSNLS
jgi:hypothetical protein